MPLSDGNITIKLSDLTPEWLKTNYLTGLRFVDYANKDYPDSFYETHMQNAVAKIEKLCDICILELTTTAEQHDYQLNDYMQWGFLRLYKVPVKWVTALRGVYPANTDAVSYPTEAIEVIANTGQLNIVPTAGTLGSLIIGQGGSFVPLVHGQVSQIPNFWEVDYTAGMDYNNLPRMICEAIAKLACMDILTIMSDLARPIGVTSESVSIDGLSQSQGYQIPAFQARLKQYTSDLYGPEGKNQLLAMTSGLLKQIMDAYRPILLEGI